MAHKLISVEEAWNLLRKHSVNGSTEALPLKNALNRVLAENVFSSIDMPPFHQSAVDGYALGTGNTNEFKVRQIIPAGSAPADALSENEAARVYTGAAIPDGTKAVVMQEYVDAMNGNIKIHSEKTPISGANIRSRGEQIHRGDLALPSHTQLTPAGIGYLATLGVTAVQVFQLPRIHILITGNELVAPGSPLEPGKIFESNGITLSTACEMFGFCVTGLHRVPDNEQATSEIIATCMETADVLLVSGGISVGDFDFTSRALKNNGIFEIFHKVSQKPGKPLFYGIKNRLQVFGLPGNPYAALLCFYEYVLPVLNSFAGKEFTGLRRAHLPLEHDYEGTGDRSLFLKAKASENSVTILDRQSSAMLGSLAEANALVYIASPKTMRKGDSVEVHFL